MGEEGKRYAEYDARQEFTQRLAKNWDYIQDLYGRGKYETAYHRCVPLAKSVRAFFTVDEKKSLETQEAHIRDLRMSVIIHERSNPTAAFKKHVLYPMKADLESSMIEYFGILMDTLHNHRMILPDYVEGDSGELDFDSILGQAGL